MGDLLQSAYVCIPHSDSSQRQGKNGTITTSAQFSAFCFFFIFAQIQHSLYEYNTRWKSIMSTIPVNLDDWKIKSPCRMLLVGSSGSGKTEFVLKALRNDKYVFSSPADRIIICYTVLQKKITQFAEEDSRVTLHEGFDENLYIDNDPSSHLYLVVDDCMSLNIYKELSDLFSKYSRHKNISVFYITQNAYTRGTTSAVRYNRDILINRYI